MSALAMILTAMVVPRDGPEKVSGEIKNEKLDLSGEWEGTLYTNSDVKSKVYLSSERIRLVSIKDGKEVASYTRYTWKYIDEGNNRMRLDIYAEPLPAIYRQNADHVIICDGDPRPTSFRFGNSQRLYILHRVKSSK